MHTEFSEGENFISGFDEDSDLSSVFTTENDSTGDWPSPDDLSTDFFRYVLVKDERIQKEASKRTTDLLRESLYSDKVLIQTHLPTVVRYSRESPLRIIREHFTEFLNEISPILAEMSIVLPQYSDSPTCFFFYRCSITY
jgi:hypothetical protein